MNLAPRWVQWLRTAGVDAVHWTDVGAPTATDPTIFSYAHQRGLVVFTHDLDFGALLAHTRARGPSVIRFDSVRMSEVPRTVIVNAACATSSSADSQAATASSCASGPSSS